MALAYPALQLLLFRMEGLLSWHEHFCGSVLPVPVLDSPSKALMWPCTALMPGVPVSLDESGWQH